MNSLEHDLAVYYSGSDAYEPEFDPYEEPEKPVRQCAWEGCSLPMHPHGEGDFCIVHELQVWREELKKRWFETPPNPERIAATEAQVRIWQALMEACDD